MEAKEAWDTWVKLWLEKKNTNVEPDEEEMEILIQFAGISFKAGQKEIIDWIISHKKSWRANPDNSLISVTSAEWTEEEWQTKQKE